MFFRFAKTGSIALLALLTLLPCASFSQPSNEKKSKDKPPREKNVASFDGGIALISDGDMPGGPCFRIKGNVFAENFFEDLKRIDFDNADSVFRRGKETVTQFPEKMRLEFTIRDFPCSLKIDQAPSRSYLTRPEIETLRVGLFWKHHLELRPVERLGKPELFVHAVPPPTYATAVDDLPQKYEWTFVYEVASADIPVTDSLVIILRTPAGYVAARVAARM